jgi:hypothetical protein
MEIKKLNTDITDEGITLQLVNQINMKTNFSPVILKPGDKPVKLIPCSTGFWVMYESGQYLKDEKNKLIVFSDKDCRIGRARYLLKYGKKEKAKKIADLIKSWKEQVQVEIEKVKKKITEFERYKKGDDSDIFVMIMKNADPERFKHAQEQAISKL